MNLMIIFRCRGGDQFTDFNQLHSENNYGGTFPCVFFADMLLKSIPKGAPEIEK